MNANFKKLSLKEGLNFSVSEKKEMVKIWDEFINDKQDRNMYLTSNSLDNMKKIFFSYFKIIEAAGGLVFNNYNQLLCIKRWGKWDLPKGKIKKNETIEHAAIREVIEETGISVVKIIQFKETTYHIYQSPYHQNSWVLKPTYWYVMKYEGHENLVPQLNEDITEAKWINNNELHLVKQDTYASLKNLFEY